MQHAIPGKVKHRAFSLAWSIPSSSPDHLFPEASAECVAIQYYQIHIRHVHAFGEDGVIAHDLELSLGEAVEEFGSFFQVGCAVYAHGLNSSMIQKLRQFLRFKHGSAKYDSLRECRLDDPPCGCIWRPCSRVF